MKFSEVLSLFSSKPKTLTEASATIDTSKATLDSVNALFAAAGLPLEQMLATGPDALKAHLASLDKSADVTRLTGELKTATDSLASATANLTAATALHNECVAVFSQIGFEFKPKEWDAAKFKASHEDFVSKKVTLALAKTGHPPAHVPAAVEPAGKSATAAELHAQWKAMKAGPERLAFFTQHEAAITAFERSGGTS